ncbi:hypothetical protein CR164_01920 [Prosthecochloris marina]|uniref:histidine kinase n=1 Tax=Prosthecochloris marina TaxID=2017681 RepID=A0A317T9B9_9CHLB|nr:ATP-binding protein [Prosthecochloris marina]PWW83334.1 hypothetical protein CR164_01920 [Prosthecochloris marina]
MNLKIKPYRVPVFFFILALLGLTWWSFGVRQNADEIRRKGQHQIVSGLFNIAESIIYEVDRNNNFQYNHMMVTLEKLVSGSPLTFIFLEQDGKRVFQTSGAPATLSLPSTEGEQFEENHFLFWHKTKIFNDPTFTSTPQPAIEDIEKSHSLNEQRYRTLVMGGEFVRDKQEYAEALGRMYFTQLVAFLCVAAGFIVWFMMIRSRLLTEQLKVERIRLAYIEDLEFGASGLAHETKNPLGIISGIAQQIIRDPAIPDNSRKKLEQIINEVDKTTARLGHFLNFARQKNVKTVALDAQNIIGKVISVLQAEFEEAGVALESECPAFQILADEEMLRQILVNLLLNSLQASSKNGMVTVKLQRNRKHAELVVTDNGCGISPELLPKIHKPYVTGRTEGHGLGMAIVKRYTDNLRWTISISSEINEGTTVTISGIMILKVQGQNT